jgi:hypothetical protein
MIHPFGDALSVMQRRRHCLTRDPKAEDFGVFVALGFVAGVGLCKAQP